MFIFDNIAVTQPLKINELSNLISIVVLMMQFHEIKEKNMFLLVKICSRKNKKINKLMPWL